MENIAPSVSRAVILSAEHAEVKILFQAKLYLSHHHLGSLWFSASNSLTRHQAQTTAHRENRSHFTSVQDHLLLYCFLEFYWMFSQHTVHKVQNTEALTLCRLVCVCKYYNTTHYADLSCNK